MNRFEFEGPFHLYDNEEHCYWIRESELARIRKYINWANPDGWIPVDPSKMPESCHPPVIGWVTSRPAHPGYTSDWPFPASVIFVSGDRSGRVVSDPVPPEGEWRLNGLDEEHDRGVVTVTHWYPMLGAPQPTPKPQ
jgi:hypothetical protein